MAKDILKFHSVFWPALLMAAELELPERLFVHGYLLMDEEKMSKSLGNVIDPFEVIDLYGSDALRFYLMREVALGQDGSVSPEGFENRYVTELANEYGNLASRSLAMIERYRDGRVPEGEPAAGAAPSRSRASPGACAERFDRVEVTAALEDVWRSCARSTATSRTRRRGSSPRTPRRRGASTTSSTRLAEGLRVVSILLLPFVPDSADRLLTALGSEHRGLEAASLGAAPGGAQISSLAPLFPRIERPAAPSAA